MKAKIRLLRGKKKEEFNFRLEGADVTCEKVVFKMTFRKIFDFEKKCTFFR